ncbi:hypothetical protein LVB77_00585 [Lysobacter sp. 5GHs7-4]|uniref:hypothetical protein n=1 Tax=Lysobacter sp. 5GHs7-4 TaxID=2904253 RepID=UPI001E55B4F6|nr:hypothetical protein [Lysobacter sp. 5GHs7-4]UHQ23243.1 hypothetical protein LVB77_00585 [Lysobacter sp. 5GHs7-4]
MTPTHALPSIAGPRSKRLHGTVLLAAALLIASPAGAADDIDFVRGCWATRATPGGPVDGFLRLLPDREVEGALSGHAMSAYGDPPVSRLDLMFARDGSTLGLRRPIPGYPTMDARLPSHYLRLPQVGAALLPRADGGHVAAYRQDGADEWIVVKAHDERLLIQRIDGDGRVAETYFDGERDGCD